MEINPFLNLKFRISNLRFQMLAAAGLLLLTSLCLAAQDKPKEEQGSVVPQIDTVQIEKYLYLIDHMTRLAENGTACGVAATVRAAELLRDHPQQAIDYFNRSLADVKNDSVRRAIRLQLAELYKQTDQTDKALEELRQLMVLAPAPPSGRPRTTRSSTQAPDDWPEKKIVP